MSVTVGTDSRSKERCSPLVEEPRRLTAGEKDEVRRKLAADFEKETSLITGTHRELYAELMSLMPSTACWQLLVE